MAVKGKNQDVGSWGRLCILNSSGAYADPTGEGVEVMCIHFLLCREETGPVRHA